MAFSFYDEFTFVSLYTQGRSPLLQDRGAKKLVLARLLETKQRFRLHVAGYVLLDDHMHWLFSEPDGGEGSAIINFLRAGVQNDWRKLTPGREDAQVWEHGARLQVVRGKAELRHHMDFIHYDPVRHGLVERATDYTWSSLPARVAEGYYPDDWAVEAPPAGVARVVRPVAEMQ